MPPWISSKSSSTGSHPPSPGCEAGIVAFTRAPGPIHSAENEISILNTGRGIPIELHKKEKVYIPEMIFGHLLTGSNFNDDERKVRHWCPSDRRPGPSDGVIRPRGPVDRSPAVATALAPSSATFSAPAS